MGVGGIRQGRSHFWWNKSSHFWHHGQFVNSSLLLPCPPLKKVKESKDLQTKKRLLGPYLCCICVHGALGRTTPISMQRRENERNTNWSNHIIIAQRQICAVSLSVLPRSCDCIARYVLIIMVGQVNRYFSDMKYQRKLKWYVQFRNSGTGHRTDKEVLH